MKLALGVVLSLSLVGCAGTGDHEGDHGTPPVVTRATPQSAADSDGSGSRALVADPRSTLVGVRVGRIDGRLTVASAWSRCRHDSCRQAIAVSDDHFASARYLPGTPRNWRRLVLGDVQPPTAAQRDAVAPLLPQVVPSLAPVQALVAGGDGATLLPFERAARSEDGGATWTTYDVPRIEGALAYVAGGVALADGRLVVLLDHWSGDREGNPQGPFHGLWASEGADWAAYRPLRPDFRPALTPDPHGGSPVVALSATPSDGLVVLTTWDGRVYVSEDSTRSFHEVAAR